MRVCLPSSSHFFPESVKLISGSFSGSIVASNPVFRSLNLFFNHCFLFIGSSKDWFSGKSLVLPETEWFSSFGSWKDYRLLININEEEIVITVMVSLSNFRFVMMSGALESNNVESVVLDTELATGEVVINELVEYGHKEHSISKNEELMHIEESTFSSSKLINPVESTCTTDSALGNICRETDDELILGGCVDANKVSNLRVQIRNIPPFLKYKQVKELLSKYV